MTTPSVLEQAKEGDAAAIAALLTQALKSKGIAVRGDRQSYCLQLWFTGNPAPPQTATVAYARRAIAKLQVPSIGILELYGEQQTLAQPVWREEIALLSAGLMEPESHSLATVDADGGADSEELRHILANDPPPAAIARAYQELGLQPGDALPQVESVYFKRRAEMLRKGDRAALEPLKWAFTTIKTHLEERVTAPELSSGSTLMETPGARGMASVRQPSQSFHQRPSQPAPVDDTDVLSFQNRYSNGLVFPVLLVLGMLMNAMPIVNALLQGIKIWIHEFGHATVAWLSGRQAIPLPVGWTNVNPQRSLFVYLGVFTLLGLLYWAGRREGQRWPMVLAGVLAVVQFAMTWLLSPDTFDMLLAFGGIGGELYLSALLMVSFYFPLPEYFRWDFYRFPVVLGAAFCFWGQVWLWGQIRQGKESIPFGSMWGDVDHGDMNQLVNIHGWTPGDVIGTYSAIAHLCLLAIFGVYGYTLFRQHRETFIALGRQWLP